MKYYLCSEKAVSIIYWNVMPIILQTQVVIYSILQHIEVRSFVNTLFTYLILTLKNLLHRLMIGNDQRLII